MLVVLIGALAVGQYLILAVRSVRPRPGAQGCAMSDIAIGAVCMILSLFLSRPGCTSASR
jgi:hypothetical protein